jgi:hypothetical protein
MIDNPPDWLREWSQQVGAELKDALRESPSWIAFAHENGTVYHTYTVMAPDPFVAPYYSFLLDRTPWANQPSRAPGRKDEYPTDAGLVHPRLGHVQTRQYRRIPA